MPSTLETALAFIRACKANDLSADKARIQEAFARRFRVTKIRSVYSGDGYALRFSEARAGSFSNTVLSLSALRAYDDNPFVVVVVRSRGLEFLLANSTFLRKISHSSHELRVDNIKGSFNGTDIVTIYDGIENKPENFEQLFAQHSAFTWAENVTRLVEATNGIIGRNVRFRPTGNERAIILEAPARAASAIESAAFLDIEKNLQETVDSRKGLILSASSSDNVNLRGNAIEQILTGDANAHELGDLVRAFGEGRLVIDIKTKLLDRASAPKAYNVDKFLAFLAEPGSVFAFFVVGIDVHNALVSSRLLSVFDDAVLDATGVQHHWAGRGSRGVTQLSGQFGRAIKQGYEPQIDVRRAHLFLERLLSL